MGINILEIYRQANSEKQPLITEEITNGWVFGQEKKLNRGGGNSAKSENSGIYGKIDKMKRAR